MKLPNIKLSPQQNDVLSHLATHGSITSLWAWTLYGVSRLASRISELRKFGFKIEKRMIARKRRKGDFVQVAEYRFVKGRE